MEGVPGNINGAMTDKTLTSDNKMPEPIVDEQKDDNMKYKGVYMGSSNTFGGSLEINKPNNGTRNSGDTDDEDKEVGKHCDYIKEFLDIYENIQVDKLSENAAGRLQEVTERMAMFVPGSQGIKAPKTNDLKMTHNQKLNRKDYEKIGAIPKNYRQKEESDTASSGDTSSSDDNGKDNQRRKTHKNKGSLEDTLISEGVNASDAIIFAKLIDKLDSRRAPEFDDFIEDEGETLGDYLDRFEEYCMENVKGQKGCRAWVSELQKHLSDDMRTACEAVTDKRDNYYTFKGKLLSHYGNTKDLRKKKNRQAFEQANYGKNESLYLFSVKLRRLFTIAYPKKDDRSVNKSSKLINKFTECMPRKFRKYLEDKMFDAQAEGKTLLYAQIQAYAQIRDRDDANKPMEAENASINITQGGGKSTHAGMAVKPDNTPVTEVNYSSQNNSYNRQNQGYAPRSFQNSQYQYNHNGYDFSEATGKDVKPANNGNPSYNQGRGRGKYNGPRNEQYNPGTSRGRGFFFHRGNMHQNQRKNEDHRNRNDSVGGRPKMVDQLRRFIPPDRIIKCNLCGRIGHMDRECRACWACGKLGHRLNECPNQGQLNNSGNKHLNPHAKEFLSGANNQPLNRNARQMGGASTEQSHNPQTHQQ